MKYYLVHFLFAVFISTPAFCQWEDCDFNSFKEKIISFGSKYESDLKKGIRYTLSVKSFENGTSPLAVETINYAYYCRGNMMTMVSDMEIQVSKDTIAVVIDLEDSVIYLTHAVNRMNFLGSPIINEQVNIGDQRIKCLKSREFMKFSLVSTGDTKLKGIEYWFKGDALKTVRMYSGIELNVGSVIDPQLDYPVVEIEFIDYKELTDNSLLLNLDQIIERINGTFYLTKKYMAFELIDLR